MFVCESYGNAMNYFQEHFYSKLIVSGSIKIIVIKRLMAFYLIKNGLYKTAYCHFLCGCQRFAVLIVNEIVLSVPLLMFPKRSSFSFLMQLLNIVWSYSYIIILEPMRPLNRTILFFCQSAKSIWRECYGNSATYAAKNVL
ncbi:unnamed protein product [Meganyctiphanes norvegica]|uniref:Uncharacterized protein n=1 Tax=Meganyctiphanes norvegica TaxID=48144 RepID=A0AAV2QU86_MEGNR